LTGLVYLDVYSPRVFRDNLTTKEKKCMQIQRLGNDKVGIEGTCGEDLFHIIFNSGVSLRHEEKPEQQDIQLPDPFPDKSASNPLLFDLPPPITHC
jgi:hypothetical protein